MSRTGGRGVPISRAAARYAVLAGAAATVLAAVFGLSRLASIEIPPPDAPRDGHIFVTTYDPPRTKLETMIDVADGQAWAAFAMDPTYSHAEVFHDGAREFVYRAQRPGFGWLVWAGSLGQPSWVPVALFALTCVGVGLLAATSVLLAAQRGRDVRLAPLTALLPGSLLLVVILGPEPLAVACAFAGIVLWYGPPRHRALAVAAFTAAVLMRDVLALVPLTMLVHELLRARRPWREAAPLLLPPVVLAAWDALLRVRYGYWVWESNDLGRLAPPFVGWYHALFEPEVVRTFSFVLGVVLVVMAVRRDRWSVLTWIVLAFALSTVVMGPGVLGTESYRPLLAMYAAAVIEVLPDAGRRGADPATARAPAAR